MIDAIVDVLSGFPVLERTVLVLAVSIVAAVLLEFVVLRLARRAVEQTSSGVDDILFEELRRPVVVTAVLGGVYVLTQTPSTSTDVLGKEQLAIFFGLPAASILIILWAWSLNRVVNRAVASVDKTGKYDFAPVFSNVFTLVIILGAGFLVLTIWGIEITPLLGAAGIAGVAIGFAAKDTVANFFGGLALYFDDTYKIGDYVVLDTGDSGTVVRVGIRSTTLLTRDEVMVTIPNALLNNSSIINESAPQRRRRIRVSVGVAYGTDLDAFEDVLVDVATDEKLVLDSPSPRTRFREFGDSALQYELLCWVSTPIQRAKAIHHLNRGIHDAMNDAEMKIPFPQRDVNLTGSADAFTGNGVDAPGAADAAEAGAPEAASGDAGEAAASDTTEADLEDAGGRVAER